MADKQENGNLMAAAFQDLRIQLLDDEKEAFQREEPADKNTRGESTRDHRLPPIPEFWQSIQFPPDDRSESGSDGDWAGSQAGYGPPAWADNSQEYPIIDHYDDHLLNCIQAVHSWTTVMEEPIVRGTSNAFNYEATGAGEKDKVQGVQEHKTPWSQQQRHAIMKPSASKIKHVFMHPGLYRELEPILSINELAEMLLDCGAQTFCETAGNSATSMGKLWKVAVEQVKRNENVQFALLDLRESGMDAQESIVEGNFNALVNAMKRPLGIRIKTRSGLKYGVGGILAAQNFAIHGITDNTFEDENGSILFVTEAKCTRSFPAQVPWYRATRGVQTIGAVMSSSSRYHSEMKQDDEHNERSQTEKDKKIEINTAEISSSSDTEDKFKSPRVAVRAPVILYTQDRFKVFVATRRAGDSKFGIATYPPGYEMGDIPLVTSYISCSCSKDSCDTCNDQRRDFLEVLTLCMLQEIPAPAVPCESPTARADVVKTGRSETENLPSAEKPFRRKTRNCHRPLPSSGAEEWKGRESFVLKLGSTWRVIWYSDPAKIGTFMKESTTEDSDGSVSDYCEL
jgi:hypothetical protein